MIGGNYRVTKTGKIVIFQILLFLLGSITGVLWRAYSSDKRWNAVLYRGVKAEGLHVSNRSIREDETLIKAGYVQPLMNEDLVIWVKDKSYKFSVSRLIKDYSIESTVINAANSGEKLGLYEKNKILNKNISQLYNIKLVFNESYIGEIINTIENSCNKEPVNASIESSNHENIFINSDIKGYKVDGEGLERAIKDKINNGGSDMNIRVPFIVAEADITADKISLINSKLASFETSFSSSSYERANNIELSAKLINGTLLMADEVFSFNDKVGERTKDRGFMIAPVIVGDKIDSGVGGGICQVSTTLYNAILRAGIKPMERTHHSLPSSYVSLGLDATVDWNNIDFKFKNTLNYPIYIEAYTENKNLYVNIYGNSSLLNKKYIISSTIYNKPQAAVKIFDNKSPLQAYNEVRVIRDTYENESLIASEIISDDKYVSVQKK